MSAKCRSISWRSVSLTSAKRTLLITQNQSLEEQVSLFSCRYSYLENMAKPSPPRASKASGVGDFHDDGKGDFFAPSAPFRGQNSILACAIAINKSDVSRARVSLCHSESQWIFQRRSRISSRWSISRSLRFGEGQHRNDPGPILMWFWVMMGSNNWRSRMLF